jgi:hypothetical protein
LASALEWVDRPVQSAREELSERGANLLERYRAEHGEAPPPDERARRLLERVTIVAPWTEPAWRAAGLLGYTDATPASDR